MTLSVTTDHDEIAAVLDRFLAADPIAGTLLGTIRTSLEASAWAAVDGARLAVRSAAEWPVAVTGDWPAAACAELVGLLRTVPDVRGVSGPTTVAEAVADRLGAGRPATRMGQGLFRCDELVPPRGVPGTAARATGADRDLVHEWYAGFAADVGHVAHPSRQVVDRLLDSGACWLWRERDGRAVSMAARRPVVAGSARVGPVYTPPPARGHGYGSAVTAAATRDILDEGAVPVLFTDLANPTSNKIYRQLGYRPVDERVVITFS